MSDEMTWENCLQAMRPFNDHYSMAHEHHPIIYQYLTTLCPMGGTVVELGVCNGRTFALLVYVARFHSLRVIGIDTFLLQRPETGDDTEEMVRAKLDHLDAPYWLFNCNTHDFDTSRLAGPIDFLIIDAGHDEANVRPDCEKYLPLVSPGGVVVFHDWPANLSRDDAHWAVRHYGELHTAHWDDLYFRTGLKIRQKPKEAR